MGKTTGTEKMKNHGNMKPYAIKVRDVMEREAVIWAESADAALTRAEELAGRGYLAGDVFAGYEYSVPKEISAEDASVYEDADVFAAE